MKINRSIDAEYAAQQLLAPYFAVFCRPLPETYPLPNLLITQVGGQDTDRIDAFDLVLDARAETEAEASEYLRNALGVLQAASTARGSEIRRVRINTFGSWGNDPVRPDLALCSARIRVWAHPENLEVTGNGQQ